MREDERRVGVLNVEACSHCRFGRIALCKSFVATWDRPILSPSPLRHKAAIWETELDRHVKRGSVHTGLSAGDDRDPSIRQRILAGYRGRSFVSACRARRSFL